MVSAVLLAGVAATAAGWALSLAAGATRTVRPGTALRVGLPGGPLAGVAAAAAVGLSASTALALAVPLAILASLGVVRALDGVRAAWGVRLRSRFLRGVPWGSLVSILGVAGFYWVAQGGWAHPNAPLTLPFTSWSYLYPFGVLTAPFAHASIGHVTGNLLATAVYAPLAEYAWSHYPERRGSTVFGSWVENPYVRAFVVFPLAVACVAVLTSALAWGPIIGFSGVVFAFGAFALTRYPAATVAATAASGFASTLYYALRDPVVVASAGPSYGGPWWAGIAVQGHATGVFLGVLLGALLVAHRDARPSALRLWGGAVVYAASVPLYVLWWYRGPGTYVLYRGLGVLFVVALALLVAAGVRAGPRALAPRLGLDLSRRQAAALALCVPLVVTAFVAVPVNLRTVADHTPQGDAVRVGDYSVTYAENVRNERVGAVDVSFLNETTNVTASGVIVSNPRRHIWTEAASAGRLAFDGRASVTVGGLGWRETVAANRTGWLTAGGPTAYRVSLRAPNGTWRPVYASANATASPTIAGRNVTVATTDGFSLVVSRANETLGRAALPTANATTTAGGLTFERDGERVRAVRNGTRVTVAARETYA